VSNDLTSNLIHPTNTRTSLLDEWDVRLWKQKNGHSLSPKNRLVATCKEFRSSHTFDSHKNDCSWKAGGRPKYKDLLMTLKIGWLLEAHCHPQHTREELPIMSNWSIGGIGPWERSSFVIIYRFVFGKNKHDFYLGWVYTRVPRLCILVMNRVIRKVPTKRDEAIGFDSSFTIFLIKSSLVRCVLKLVLILGWNFRDLLFSSLILREVLRI
jgi:hypothetical protein